MSIFREKVCLVTGGGSGIGREICRQLADQGACVTVADLNEEAARKVAQEISDHGGTATASYVDVTDPKSVEALIDASLAQHGRLDYMFNNAGITVVGEFRDLPLEELKKVLDVNLTGILHGSHYAYQVMAEQGSGHIVNTASGFGLVPGPTNLPYTMAKFGVVGLSETMRCEGLDLGIKVSTICPGYIRTSMIDNMRTFNADAQDVISQIPAKMIDPQQAVRLILRGVEKNRAIIAFPSYVGVLTFLYRCFPKLFLRYSLTTIRKFRGIRKKSES